MQLSSMSSLCLVLCRAEMRWEMAAYGSARRDQIVLPCSVASQRPRATSGTITPNEVDGTEERCGTGDESVKNFND